MLYYILCWTGKSLAVNVQSSVHLKFDQPIKLKDCLISNVTRIKWWIVLAFSIQVDIREKILWDSLSFGQACWSASQIGGFFDEQNIMNYYLENLVFFEDSKVVRLQDSLFGCAVQPWVSVNGILGFVD